MKKNAIIITWTGYEDHELVYPYFRLLGAGYKVSIIGDQKDDKNRIYGKFGIHMPCHVLLKDFYNKTESFHNENDLLIIPGGVNALEKLRQESEVKEFVRKWDTEKKIIGSICSAAQLLISSKITKGRKITGYYSLEDDINNSGAEYVKQNVVIDQNLISSPHYNFMGEWMEAVIKVYKEKNG